MKKFAIVFLGLLTALPALAQTKTVTNADLEKFRAQRLESERQLRENYARLGFPSPEELEKQRIARRAELEQYSDQLRRERIERENAEQLIALNNQVNALSQELGYLRNQGFYYPGVFYTVGYPSYGYGKNRVLRRISNLPPNMRTVYEHALGYPNTPGFNRQFLNRGGFPRFKGGTNAGGFVRFGGGRGVTGGGFVISGRRR